MTGCKRWRDSGQLERAIETAGGPEAFEAETQQLMAEARSRRPADMRRQPIPADDKAARPGHELPGEPLGYR